MARLEELTKGAVVRGILPDALVTVVDVDWHGGAAITLTYRGADGRLGNEILYREREPTLAIADAGRPWSFDGDSALFRLVSEANRIRLRNDGRYEARVSLPDGRRKSFFGKTRAEVAKKMTEASAERDKGIYTVTDDRQTLGAYLAQWLETQRLPIVKPRTWDRYGLDIRHHLIPALGRIRLTKLTAMQVQTFYGAKRTEGLAPASIAHIHAVLHAALDDAERLGAVTRNVSRLVTAPRPARHEMQVLTPEQAKRLLQAVQGDHLEALYVLALTTTMRQGELLALR